MTTDTQPTDQVEQNPQQGGSFTRLPDGTLVPATQPDPQE